MLDWVKVSGWRSVALVLVVSALGGLAFAAFVLLADELFP
jgi:hypothetical protein